MTNAVDVVVVGSGPGGAVTARACAEAGLRVLVLEEGDSVEPGAAPPFSLEQMRLQYRGEGLTVALGRPSVAYTEGRGVGGGSEVNAGLYHRPPAAVLQEWRDAAGLDDLTPESLEPWSIEVERRLSVQPWPSASLPPVSAALERGARRLGWDGLDVPRWVRYGANGPERQGMSRTYLQDAQGSGAEVRDRSRVHHLDIVGGRCRGVEVLSSRTGRPERIRADVVVVSAGATQTPALLQRSGIHARGRVGANLAVHPTVKVVAVYPEALNDGSDVPTYQVKEFAPDLSFGGSASTSALVGLTLADSWADGAPAAEQWRCSAVYYAAIRGTGRGRVQAVPGAREPLVTYRHSPRDIALLRSGLARLLELSLASGALAVHPGFARAPVVRRRADIGPAVEAFTRSTASLMSVHLFGTARMGADPRASVTDPFGRVWGVEGLRVNDASLLPGPLGANPQGTVMAIAHRNVQELLST